MSTTDRDLFEEEQQMAAMSFGDHIEELRTRLILALLGLAGGVVLTLLPPLYLGKRVVDGMQNPAQQALGEYYAGMVEEKKKQAIAEKAETPMIARIPVEDLANEMRKVFPSLPAPDLSKLNDQSVHLPLNLRDDDLISVVNQNIQREYSGLITLGPMEAAVIFFTVCVVSGLVFASPWVFYHLWAFVAAGLYRHERSYVYKFLPFSLGLFLAGVFLCYFGVLPLTLRFLLQFNMWLNLQPNLRLTEWMSFATILPLVFGIGFQTPLVMMFVAKIGILTSEDFRAKRKLAILITVIAAAILTPDPSMISQLMLAIPMIGLYELGIILVARSEARELAGA